MRLACALVALGAAACIVDVDHYAGGNPAGGTCARDEQCDPGLVCDVDHCAAATSCADLLARRPRTRSGRYPIALDRTGVSPPRPSTCDMDRAGGGWMLVEPGAIWNRRRENVTAVEESDAAGGLVATFYANTPGCGTPSAYESTYLERAFPWKEIRFRETFAGGAACYSILGGSMTIYVEPPHLVPFQLGRDPVLTQINMGADTDAFDGRVDVCDNPAHHFWTRNDGLPRAIEVILPRSPGMDAGIGTGVSCNLSAEGTSSPTWWRYSDVYVR